VSWLTRALDLLAGGLPGDRRRKVTPQGHPADRVSAAIIEDAANVISGLRLEAIGEDGHSVANKLWRICSHLRQRSLMSCPCGRGDYGLCASCPYDICHIHGKKDR